MTFFPLIFPNFLSNQTRYISHNQDEKKKKREGKKKNEIKETEAEETTLTVKSYTDLELSSAMEWEAGGDDGYAKK